MTLHFSGHETFPFRYAWPAKGVRAFLRNPDIFNREDSLIELGVGKNMVKSIRHWCFAMGLVKDEDRMPHLFSERLGERLFSESGWDPGLEDPGTLWLLHWQLTRWENYASTWFLVFHRWNYTELRRDHLVEWLSEIVSATPGSRATPASIKRDVEVFLRTYVPVGGLRTAFSEDTLDCPLVELELIQELRDGIYAFRRNRHPSLPIGIFAYALADYWQRCKPHQNTLAFEELTYGEGAPGRAFRLDEHALIERLEQLADWTDGRWQLSETIGMRQLLKHGHVEPLDMLDKHYRQQLATIAGDSK